MGPLLLQAHMQISEQSHSLETYVKCPVLLFAVRKIQCHLTAAPKITFKQNTCWMG